MSAPAYDSPLVHLADIELDIPVREYVAWVEVVMQARVPLMDDALLRTLRITRGMSRRTIGTLFGLEPKEVALFLEPLLTKQLIDDSGAGEVRLGPAGLELFQADVDEDAPSQVQLEMREIRFRIDQISLAALSGGSPESYRPLPITPDRNCDRAELSAAARRELGEDSALLTGKRVDPEVGYQRLSKDRERLHRIVDLTEGRDRTWRVPASIHLDTSARELVTTTRAFRQQGDLEKRSSLMTAIGAQTRDTLSDSDSRCLSELIRLGGAAFPNLLDLTARKGLETLALGTASDVTGDSFYFIGYPETSCPALLDQSFKRANQLRNLLQGTELPLVCVGSTSKLWARGRRYQGLLQKLSPLLSVTSGPKLYALFGDAVENYDLRRNRDPLDLLDLRPQEDAALVGLPLSHPAIEILLIPDLWVRVIGNVRGFLAGQDKEVAVPMGFCSTDKAICARITQTLGDLVATTPTGALQSWGPFKPDEAAGFLLSALAGEGRRIRAPRRGADVTVTKPDQQ